MNRFLVPIVGFAVLVLVLVIGLNRDPTFVPSPLIGKQMPSFSLPRLGDPERTVTDADLRGRFSVLNVWATWCSGCRQEHPVLNQIAQQGQVPIYGLNWKDDASLAGDWLQRLGDPYELTAFDAEGRVAIDWGVYGAPETFLVNAEGHVVFRYPGPLNRAVWDDEFAPRIAELKK